MAIDPNFMQMLMAMSQGGMGGGGAPGMGGPGYSLNQPSGPPTMTAPGPPSGGIYSGYPPVGGPTGIMNENPLAGSGPSMWTPETMGRARPMDMVQPGSPYMGMTGAPTNPGPYGGGPAPFPGGGMGGGYEIESQVPGGGMYGVGGGMGGGNPMSGDGGMPMEGGPDLSTFFDGSGYKPMNPTTPGFPGGGMPGGGRDGGPQMRPPGGGFGGPNIRPPGQTPPWSPLPRQGGPGGAKPGFRPGGGDGGPQMKPPGSGGINYGPPAIRRKPGRGGIASQPPTKAPIKPGVGNSR